MRADDKNEFVVLINFSNRSVAGTVEVQNSQEFKPITPGVRNTPAGFPAFTLKGFDYRIYQRQVVSNTATR